MFKTLSKFEKYDTINESKKIMLFSNFYLPVQIIKTTNQEYELQEKTYTPEELTELLKEKLESELKENVEDQSKILNTNVNTNVENGYVEIEVTLEVLEHIGIEQEMNI